MHIFPVIFCIIRRLERTYKNLRRHAYVQAEPPFTFLPPKTRSRTNRTSSFRHPYTQSRGRPPRRSRAAPSSPPQWRNSPYKVIAKALRLCECKLILNLNDKKALKGFGGKQEFSPNAAY